MAKRVAERELTDRNWDQEDEVEEVHVYFVDMSTREPVYSIITLSNSYTKVFAQLTVSLICDSLASII